MALALREQHAMALVIARPSRVSRAAVGKMRGKQRVNMVVSQLALKRLEPDLLQDNIAMGIGQNFFLDPVPALVARIDEPVRRHGTGQVRNGGSCIPLFFGKEADSIAHQQSEVTGASLVDAGKINLIENAVTGGEPNPAMEV